MNFKISLLLTVLSPSVLFSQWTNVGFQNFYTPVIKEWNGNVIAPIRGADSKTYFYSSSNYGESWDSVGYVPASWIDDIAVNDDYLFSSLSWTCAGFCLPMPCIFRTDKNWIKSDTIYVKGFGVSNIFLHGTELFANIGNSYIHSTDFGNNWQTLTTIPASNGELHVIDSLIFLLTHTNPIFVSYDNGYNWELFNNSLPSYSNCVIKVDSILLFGGLYGIARFNNNLEWELMNVGIPDRFRVEILANSGNLIFASGMDTTFAHKILCSTNCGESWFSISKGLNIEPMDWIHSLLIQDHYLFVAASGIWRYDFSSLVDVEEKPISTSSFSLYQNYPNPFNPSTKIRYTVPCVGARCSVPLQLKVYDVLGNEIVTLVDEYKPAGSYEVEFTSNSSKDGNLPSGVYFYQLTEGSFIQTKKMLLLK